MKRLLLMVEREGRVVCAWTGSSAFRIAARFWCEEERNAMSLSGRRDMVPRWWLMLADNAEHARLLHPWDTIAQGGGK